MHRFFYLIIIFVFCSGCATEYQRQGLTGGYTDTRIQDDIFRVGFKGNGYTSTERAADLALLRCAELALENGYKYFVIMGQNEETKTSAYTMPVTANTTASSFGNVNLYGGNGYAQGTYSGNYYGTTTYSGGQTFLIDTPSTSMVIKCFKEKPDISGMIFDAEQIRTNIKQSYGIKGADDGNLNKKNPTGVISEKLSILSEDAEVRRISELYNQEIKNLTDETKKDYYKFADDNEKKEFDTHVREIIAANAYKIKNDEDFLKMIRDTAKVVYDKMIEQRKEPSNRLSPEMWAEVEKLSK